MGKQNRIVADPAANAALQRWAHDVTGVLKRERGRHGLSQAELGLNLGVAQCRVGVMERNPQQVRVERLFLALHLLGLELVVRERARPELKTDH